jgi:hypothetical protein
VSVEFMRVPKSTVPRHPPIALGSDVGGIKQLGWSQRRELRVRCWVGEIVRGCLVDAASGPVAGTSTAIDR